MKHFNITLRDYDKHPDAKRPYIERPYGSAERPGYYHFHITPKGGDGPFSDFDEGVPKGLGEWKALVYGAGYNEYDRLPGVAAASGVVKSGIGWESEFLLRDYTNPSVMEQVKSLDSPEKLAKAEHAAQAQGALKKNLRAESVVEAISALLMARLIRAEMVSKPEAQAFMHEQFGIGSVLGDHMLRCAEKEIAQKEPRERAGV